jgi:hypothetical protein
MLPKPPAVRTLLAAPRKDFAVKAQTVMVLKEPDGSSLVAGLIEGDAAGMETTQIDGVDHVELQVAAQATSPDGTLLEGPEREALVKLDEAGSFVVSYGMSLPSGSYTLTVGAVEPQTGKGGAVAMPVEAPDFASGSLVLPPLLVLEGVDDRPQGQAPDAEAALADFALASVTLRPRSGNRFETSDAVTFLAFMHGARTDEATGKASLTVGFELLKDDGTVVASTPKQPRDTPDATHTVGPLPLDTFEPGPYLARITVTDQLAGQEYTQEAHFEITDAIPAAEPVAGGPQ